MTWTPPTTGGVPTSYNVSINDSSNTLVPIPANGALQNTFTGLTSDTLYTVSVVAINCAGTSSVMSAFGRTGNILCWGIVHVESDDGVEGGDGEEV